MPGISLMGSLRTKNISQVIIDRIVSSIAAGELRPGDRLPTEEEFSARIGVGKSSVREAIKILEAFGILEIRRGDGTYIVDHFQGGMLHPAIFGMLMAQHDAADVLDMDEIIWRLVLSDVMNMRVEPDGSDDVVLLWPDDGQAASFDAFVESLEEAGRSLARREPNPLLAVLASEFVALASYQVKALLLELHQEGQLGVFRERMEALESALRAGDIQMAHAACDALFVLLRAQLESLERGRA